MALSKYLKLKTPKTMTKIHDQQKENVLAAYPLFQLIVDKLYDDVILYAQQFCDTLGYPGLQAVNIDFGHIHLRNDVYDWPE